MITMENYEGWLMRYADGALTREEREAVEAFLEQHPELREEMEEVAEVKVTPVVATLPGKERLLKKEHEGFAWWRVAAAVALMVLAGTTLLVLNRKPNDARKALHRDIAHVRRFALLGEGEVAFGRNVAERKLQGLKPA